jgi:hypothetical protein
MMNGTKPRSVNCSNPHAKFFHKSPLAVGELQMRKRSTTRVMSWLFDLELSQVPQSSTGNDARTTRILSLPSRYGRGAPRWDLRLSQPEKLPRDGSTKHDDRNCTRVFLNMKVAVRK